MGLKFWTGWKQIGSETNRISRAVCSETNRFSTAVCSETNKTSQGSTPLGGIIIRKVYENTICSKESYYTRIWNIVNSEI